MSVKTGNSVKIMVSMPLAIHNQLELLSAILGGSKSKIVQQAIILMADVMKEGNYALDKDVSGKMLEG